MNRALMGITAALGAVIATAGGVWPGVAPAGLDAALAQPRRREIKAPDFALKDLAGKTVNLSDFKGKVVLVNFWATWCPPCKKEMPDLVKLHEGYKKKGFVVLGISLDDDPAGVVPDFLAEFKKEHGLALTYPILQGDEKIGDSFGGIFGIPTSFLIDRKGFIRKKYIGPPGDTAEEIQAAFKAEITKLL